MPADPKLKQDAYRILQEVSITLDDGTEYVYLDQYGDQWAVKITPAILAPIFTDFPTPDILKVSVQPVDAKGWYRELAPDLFDENDGSGLKSQSLKIFEDSLRLEFFPVASLAALFKREHVPVGFFVKKIR